MLEKAPYPHGPMGIDDDCDDGPDKIPTHHHHRHDLHHHDHHLHHHHGHHHLCHLQSTTGADFLSCLPSIGQVSTSTASFVCSFCSLFVVYLFVCLFRLFVKIFAETQFVSQILYFAVALNLTIAFEKYDLNF